MASIAQNTAFGIVTVMDVKVYGLDTELALTVGGASKTLEEWYKEGVDRAELNAAIKGYSGEALCTLDHLTVATLSTEGPSITINGGKYNNPLIKYGKTARCEMTDALGQMDALVALGGAEYTESGIAVTDKFGAPVCIVGSSFVVDKVTGKHVPVTVILYQFLPDSTPSFAFDSGNAATFDLNGDLLATEFLEDNGEMCGDGSASFFSIEFDNCQLDDANYADVIYGANVTGPAQMKLGATYTVTASSGYLASALNLDTNAAITVSASGEITVPSADVSRILITAELNQNN